MALLAAAVIPEQRIKPAITSKVILRLVPELNAEAPTTVKRAGFATVLSGVLVTGLLALLGLNLILAKNSFALHDLREEASSLSHIEQAMTAELARAQSPQSLAEQAGALGMLPSDNVTFLRLSGDTSSTIVAERQP